MRALTHPSVIGTGAVTAAQAYERLEFLGDRVLGLVVAELLLERFPDEAEGDIAKRHAMLVRAQTLAQIARQIELDRHVRMVSSGGDGSALVNRSILSDACEAVIAALYLDGGLSVARDFITRLWSSEIDRAGAPPQDAKTMLQERVQKQGLPLPQYRVIERSGPDHQPQFTVEVDVRDQSPCRASGSSKQRAEQAAATAMLAHMDGADD